MIMCITISSSSSSIVIPAMLSNYLIPQSRENKHRSFCCNAPFQDDNPLSNYLFKPRETILYNHIYIYIYIYIERERYREKEREREIDIDIDIHMYIIYTI